MAMLLFNVMEWLTFALVAPPGTPEDQLPPVAQFPEAVVLLCPKPN